MFPIQIVFPFSTVKIFKISFATKTKTLFFISISYIWKYSTDRLAAQSESDESSLNPLLCYLPIPINCQTYQFRIINLLTCTFLFIPTVISIILHLHYHQSLGFLPQSSLYRQNNLKNISLMMTYTTPLDLTFKKQPIAFKIR